MLRQIKGWAILVLVAGASFFVTPVSAHSDDYAESVKKLQLLDVRVQNIGWRLARGNAKLCRHTRPSIGLLMQDILGYNRPDAARAVLGVPVDFAVQTAAEGSPARSAGMVSNQPITEIDGYNLSEMVEDAKAPYLRLLWAERALQSSLNANGSTSLSIAGQSEPVTISAVKICQSGFVVRPKNDRASADARNVYIGAKFPGLAYPDDELAAAMAHELAHVLLHHRQWLSVKGSKRRNVRATEREADRMMPWLLANAGYDPEAAVRFMQKWGPKHSGGLLRKRTHDGWDERAEFISAELPLIRSAMAQNGDVADWSTRFTPKPVG